jgi:hypothetical protein
MEMKKYGIVFYESEPGISDSEEDRLMHDAYERMGRAEQARGSRKSATKHTARKAQRCCICDSLYDDESIEMDAEYISIEGIRICMDCAKKLEVHVP